MKRIVFLTFALCIAAAAWAQTHTAVSVDDPVYDFIDDMILRGVIRRDVMARPWPRSKVLSTLESVRDRNIPLSVADREYLLFLIDRIDKSVEKGVLEEGAFDIPSDLFPAKIGTGWDNEIGVGISDDITFHDTTLFRLYIQGDIPGPISYAVQVRPGIVSQVGDFDSYEPYTFMKHWDGAPYYLIGEGSYGFPSEASGGLEIQSEMALSAWDDRLWARFGRIRHDWGSFGSGNLYFSGTARPFSAFELTFNPWKWFAFSALTGSLDYGVGIWNEDGRYPLPGSGASIDQPVYGSPKAAANVEQNSYSIIQLEIMPNDRFYVSIFDAVVWPKRYELDYIYPFQSNFFGQEVVGDFDNMMLGGTVAFLAPGYGQAWASLYIDEMDLLSDGFFKLDRNMYAYQVGANVPVPIFNRGKITLQYTKIEPYCYTHPPVNAPTYGDIDNDGDNYDMQTYYLNNGEPIGFYQPPNSDELRLEFTTMPINKLLATFRYRLIRHGATTGPYEVDGSSYYDYIDYYEYAGSYSTWQDDPLYKKDFLKDGAYEWQHIWGIGALWYGNLGKIPFSLGLDLDLVWSYYTYYPDSGFRIYEDANYQSSLNQIVTISFSLFP